MAKETKLSKASKQAFEVLKEKGSMTFKQLRDEIDGLNPAHLTALTNRALVDAVKVEVEEIQTVKRKVNQYSVSENADLQQED